MDNNFNLLIWNLIINIIKNNKYKNNYKIIKQQYFGNIIIIWKKKYINFKNKILYINLKKIYYIIIN